MSILLSHWRAPSGLAGLRVTLLVGPQYRSLCESNALGFVPLGTPAQQRLLKNDPFLRNPHTSLRHLWRKVVLPNATLLLDALESLWVCDPPDLVVYHPASIGVPWICRRKSHPLCGGDALAPDLANIQHRSRAWGGNAE